VASPLIQIQEFVSLAPYTTLRIGGKARYFCEVTSEAQLLEALDFAQERSLPLFVLGGGSNLLVSDAGFDGLVIRMGIVGPVQSVEDGGIVEFRVSAGVEWDDFVLQVCEQGISGVECLAGIPGLVGGTPVQNVGAYGQEVAETIVSVTALDLKSGSFVVMPREACGFAYRRSVFNSSAKGRYIVTAVTSQFDRENRPKLQYADLQKHFAGVVSEPTSLDVYHAVREIRHGKGMLLVEGEPDCRSAGSFFKNPVVNEAVLTQIAENLGVEVAGIPHWPAGVGMVKLPAAWLLDQAGFHKGFAMGAAGISSRHTLALINRGDATFTDIAALRDAIQAEVEKRFGIRLEQEPVQLGG
jgi:UDP-N-acetylmuramate dehydrogenase